MSVRRRDIGGKSEVEVVIGPDADNFNLSLAPGENAGLSEIICFGFRNKTDLDCHKLYHPQLIRDIQEMLKDMFADTMEDMLKAELDTELGYTKTESIHYRVDFG